MRTGWETATLADVCIFANGLWKGEKPPFVNVGVIRNTNFTKDGLLDDTDIAQIKVEASKYRNRQLQYGDLILEKSGGGPKQPVGRVILFEKEDGGYSFSNFTSSIRVSDKERLDFHYLHKFLHWCYLSGLTAKMQSNSTGIRNLDGDAYKSIAIPLPRKVEQERIVAKLDAAFAAIATAKANAEKNLQNARELFKSASYSIIDTYCRCAPRVPIRTVSQVFDGPHATPKTVDTGPLFLGISALEDGAIVLENTRHVTARDFEKWTRRVTPQCDDIVFSYETRLGQAAILPRDFECCLGRRMGLVRVVSKSLDPHFFLCLYLSPQFQEFLTSKTIHGATVDRFSIREFPDFQIPLPPLGEQLQVAESTASLREQGKKLKVNYTSRLAALDTLKQSLLHRAFNGEL